MVRRASEIALVLTCALGGLALSGLAGGFVSSAATIGAMGSRLLMLVAAAGGALLGGIGLA